VNRSLFLLLAALIGASPAAAQAPDCAVLARAECAPAAIRLPPVTRRLASQDTIPEIPDRWLGSDKLRHFFLSFGATGFARAGARAAGAGDASRWIGPAVAAAAGVGKELSDHARGWGFSLRDLVWDAAGIAAAALALRSTG